MDRVRSSGSALYPWRDADRDRHRHPGRGRRRDVDRSRRPSRCRRHAPSGGGGTRRPRHGPGDRSLVAVVWHPCGRRTVRLARKRAHARDGLSAGAGGPGGFGHRRAADRAGDERTSAARLAHSRRRHSVRRGDPRPCAWIRSVRTRADLCALDGGDLHHAGVGDQGARFEDSPRHPVHQHHHLRIPCNALGRRRLFLVDARPASVRRGVLRHAAPDRGDHRHRRHVAVQQATDRIFRHRNLVLARSGGCGAIAPQYRVVLRPPPLDGSDVRIRRPHHRRGRCRDIFPVCPDQHDSAPDPGRLLCARGPPADLVDR